MHKIGILVFSSMHCILEFPSLNTFTNGSIHLDHRIATEYSECIDQIFEIIQKYQNSHEIVIGGDFNEDISKNNNSRRVSKLKELIADCELQINFHG
jgi:endonuclease/exonuclease/phosphatase family metal-dependent hydrolase